MDKKYFDINNEEEVISFIGCEEMITTTINSKDEMYSEESSEVDICTPDKGIGTILINSNETEEKVQESVNDSGTSFCYIGIKMEEPDYYESKVSLANAETKFSSEQYPRNHERKCNVGDQCLEGKCPRKLSNTSCIKIKMECDKDIDICKSEFQTNDTLMITDMNNKSDSMSVVHGSDMGHSSNEFIRGIECHEYPILRVKVEVKTDKQIAVNRNNSVSVKIEEKENQEDSSHFVGGDLKYNIEEYSHNSDERSKSGDNEVNNTFLTESTTKMERKEIVDIYEMNCVNTENIYMWKSLQTNSVTSIYPVSFEKEVSRDEIPQSIKSEVQAVSERNVMQINHNMTFDETLMNDHCEDSRVKGTEDLEIQFEAVCDVSEFDIKAEKPVGSGLNSENVDEFDVKPVELRAIGKQETKNSFLVPNSSGVMLKEARVVPEKVSLQGVDPSLQTEIGKEASGFLSRAGIRRSLQPPGSFWLPHKSLEVVQVADLNRGIYVLISGT